MTSRSNFPGDFLLKGCFEGGLCGETRIEVALVGQLETGALTMEGDVVFNAEISAAIEANPDAHALR